MIVKKLKAAIDDIDKLIFLTNEDIQDIKLAHHEQLAQRLPQKESLIKSFEHKKTLLNDELLKLTQNVEGFSSLDELLTKEASEKLSIFKEKLHLLKDRNKEYSRYVLTVSEFYNSLLDRMFTLEGDGYQKDRLRPASLFKISA